MGTGKIKIERYRPTYVSADAAAATAPFCLFQARLPRLPLPVAGSLPHTLGLTLAG